MISAIETRHPREEVVAALARTVLVARGPKPVATLREYGLHADITVPEPNTNGRGYRHAACNTVTNTNTDGYSYCHPNCVTDTCSDTDANPKSDASGAGPQSLDSYANSDWG